ncbi:MAG: hypothetical protein DYG98_17060 [Haliscomenobacteraceae bacterium CHB4]|nr:hypothetical protein [Saprospiraceae bacterium]MCE7924761.1 hypothetical protein [Haliscomenobacteraceae bacterium CHB4]
MKTILRGFYGPADSGRAFLFFVKIPRKHLRPPFKMAKFTYLCALKIAIESHWVLKVIFKKLRRRDAAQTLNKQP